MSVAYDSLPKLMLTTSADRSKRGEAASDFVVHRDTLQWTQNLSGTSCTATAVLIAATSLIPATMNGTMACEDGQRTFSLRKKTG